MKEIDFTTFTIELAIINSRIELLNDQISILLMDKFHDKDQIAKLFQQQFEFYSETPAMLLKANRDAHLG